MIPGQTRLAEQGIVASLALLSPNG
jgi:hypothetical protein